MHRAMTPHLLSSGLGRRGGGRLASIQPRAALGGWSRAQVFVGDEHAPGSQVVNEEDFPPMKDLIQLYRTAFLQGNDEVLGEVEKAITAVEKEKSRVASQFESITTEITSGKEKFIRLNADLENFWKQTEKHCAKFTSNIRVEVIQSLLPLVDSFEKMNLENTSETENEQKISTSYQGIYKQVHEALTRSIHAIQGIDCHT